MPPKTVHGMHCCKDCGCKYYDEKCPVVLGLEESIECEDCSNGRNYEQELQNALKIIEELLLSGNHEGECTNKGYEDEYACDLHLEISEQRKHMAESFLLGYYNKYIFDKRVKND